MDKIPTKNKKLRVCNLFGGIGGNRKLWDTIPDVELDITMVEYKQEIADIYHDFFPKDEIIVADAHQYLLDHYKEFDFIWSSPPCPTHSRFNLLNNQQEGKSVIYPDMSLYQEIIFLQHWFKGKFCIENVVSYYKPLIVPQEIMSHYFWTNFLITPRKNVKRGSKNEKNHIQDRAKQLGISLKNIKVNSEMKRKILNNCTEPKLGKHILDCALGKQRQKTLL